MTAETSQAERWGDVGQCERGYGGRRCLLPLGHVGHHQVATSHPAGSSPRLAGAVRVPGTVYGFPAPDPPIGGSMFSNVVFTDALIAVVAIAATCAAIFAVSGFTSQDLMAVYLYVLGYATGRPVPASSSASVISPPGA
jgi:hypothetical protein